MKLLTRKLTPEQVHSQHEREKAEAQERMRVGGLQATAAAQRARETEEHGIEQRRRARQRKATAENTSEQRRAQEQRTAQQQAHGARLRELKAAVTAAEAAVSRLRGDVHDGPTDGDAAVEAARAMGAVLGAVELAKRARERVAAHERR
jgi:hypothetical protein